MIDLHSHMLPGLDDGPEDNAAAVALARAALDNGITGVVCTPHWHPSWWPNTRDHILERLEFFRGILEVQGVELELWPGCELSLETDLADHLLEGRLLSMNGGSWILLELPGMVRPAHTEKYMCTLQELGFRIVLAHPERYRYVQHDPHIVYEWVQAGIAIQLTASQVVRDGARDGTLTRLLLEHGLVHFLASDAHNLVQRPPSLRSGVEVAASVIGADAALRLVTDNPRALLANEALVTEKPIPVPRPRKKNGWFKLW